MNRAVIALVGCGLIAACQAPAPLASTVPPRRAAASPVHKTHRATFADGRRSTGEAEFATDCPWPVHAHAAAVRPRLGSSTVQTGTGPASAVVEAEGCAILRFSLSPSGHVNWIEVVSAKPQSIGPLALKCLLAARFKPDPRPEATSLVRVDVRKLAGDVAVAALKLR